MLKLFYHPGACSLASHIILEEIGLPFETVMVDVLAGDQHKPEFLAINPHGKVPALATDDGVLTETPAILTYLADRRPELDLLPADPFERATIVSMITWLSCTVHAAFARIWRQGLITDDQSAWPNMREKAIAQIEAAFVELDHRLEGRNWLFDNFSVADAHCLVMTRWGYRARLNMAAFPHLTAHAKLLATRPSAERAIAREGIKVLA